MVPGNSTVLQFFCEFKTISNKKLRKNRVHKVATYGLNFNPGTFQLTRLKANVN